MYLFVSFSLCCVSLFVVFFKHGVFGTELGDCGFHESNHVGDAHLTREFLQFICGVAGIGVVILTNFCHADAAVLGGEGVLVVGEHFFVEFLAGTKPGVFNLYVATGGETGEFNHAFGKVGNLHAGTHVKDVDLVALTHGGCFHHQTTRLGDGHEEARDVGMGDGDRTTLGDLFAEAGNDGAVGTQDITEAGGDEACLALHFSFLNGESEALDVDFSQALGATHDVGGVHGFVCADHDHLFDVIFNAFVCHVATAGNIDEDSFAGGSLP